jgi:glycosyltransferase involved in cell wall biosynthesis
MNAVRLMRAVADDDLDLAQGHNPPHCAWAGLGMARRLGIPFIYEAHRLSFDSFGANQKWKLPAGLDGLARWIIRSEEKVFFEAGDAVIVQTEAHRRRVLELFRMDPQRTFVIPMGVDEAEFDPQKWAPQGQALRARHGWGEKIVFMYNGYLGDTNGVEPLIRAAGRLPADVKRRIRVVILGRGPLADMVAQACRAAPDVLENLGLVDYREMPAYYSAVDVVAIPLAPILLWECNNPTKLLEAMAMENIVLASDVHGVTELMENGHSGITYAKGDLEDLARQMVHIVENFDGLVEMRKQARTAILQARSWRACRAMQEEVYDLFR